MHRMSKMVVVVGVIVGGALVTYANQPAGTRKVTDERSGQELSIAPKPIRSVAVDQLTSQTQRVRSDRSGMLMVWWIPTEYWEVSYAQDRMMTDEGIEALLAPLRRHTLVAVVEAKIGPFGAATFQSELQVRAKTRLHVGDGEAIAPLPPAGIDPDTQNMINMMRPILAQTMGNVGQNLHFLVFPVGADGRPLVDPYSCERLTVAVGDQKMVFDMPVPALLKDKHCQKCGRDFRGDYVACPYDKTSLQFAEAEATGTQAGR